mmetsp:Transcript_45165/g.82694  ORF Transcript_45165/g.82694 Transcript_45165/m.82694 type:complete len:329 (+) Transcript_45165:6-992(+)
MEHLLRHLATGGSNASGSVPAGDVGNFAEAGGGEIESPVLQCELLGKWGSFGWWLQAFLGLTCLVSLVGKRFTDTVRRPWKVWFFDTSKQFVQACLNHLINIGLSMAFGEWLDSDTDPCNWYCINLTLDCTLGVGLLFLLLRMLQCTYRSERVGRPELARCGEYGDPPDVRIFARQLLDWEGLVIVQKITLTTMVVHLRSELASIADVLLGWLDDYPRVKLVVVMVAAPLILNVFAFWTADSFLQADPYNPKDRQAREPLTPFVVGHGDGDSPATLQDLEGDESDRLVSFQEWKQRAVGFRSGLKTGQDSRPTSPSSTELPRCGRTFE